MGMTREDGGGDTRMTRYAGMENIHSTKHTTAILLESRLFYKKYVRDGGRACSIRLREIHRIRVTLYLDGFFECVSRSTAFD